MSRSLRPWWVGSAVTLTLLLWPRLAAADAIGLADACPPGSRGEVAHLGTWCVAATCTETCEPIDGLAATCRAMRVCTEVHEVDLMSPAAALSGFEGEPRSIEMVVETCEVDGGCDGSGDRAPSVGRREGPVRCATERVCVPGPLPPLSSRTSVSAAPPSAPPAVEPPAAPSPPSAMCDSRAHRPRTASWVWLVLALFVLAPRVRRTWPVALALVATAAVPAAAQPLPAPFVERSLPAGFGDLEALACADDVAYARAWQGNVAALRADWEALAAVPDRDVGSNLVVEGGVVFTTVRGGIARYEGGAWIRTDAPTGAVYTRQIAAFGGHAIAVGRGRVVAWDGARYTAYAAGTWRDLMAVWGPSETDLWVAGERGVAFHFDGRAMTAHPVPTAGTVTRLHGTSTRDVWAVVERPAGVFHWDGARWSDRSAGLAGRPTAVHAAGDRVIVVGDFGVVRWGGDAWLDVHRVAAEPYSLPRFVDVCFTATSIVIGARDTTWVAPRAD